MTSLHRPSNGCINCDVQIIIISFPRAICGARGGDAGFAATFICAFYSFEIRLELRRARSGFSGKSREVCTKTVISPECRWASGKLADSVRDISAEICARGSFFRTAPCLQSPIFRKYIGKGRVRPRGQSRSSAHFSEWMGMKFFFSERVSNLEISSPGRIPRINLSEPSFNV